MLHAFNLLKSWKINLVVTKWLKPRQLCGSQTGQQEKDSMYGPTAEQRPLSQASLYISAVEWVTRHSEAGATGTHVSLCDSLCAGVRVQVCHYPHISLSKSPGKQDGAGPAAFSVRRDKPPSTHSFQRKTDNFSLAAQERNCLSATQKH